MDSILKDDRGVEQIHKRRIHYSGQYPKKYNEKYKELNSEKYEDEISHILSKGNTPVGMHVSIMIEEILQVLDIKPGERGFDGTLGYGGHSCAMLKKLDGRGHLYSCDIDPIEFRKTEIRLRKKGYGSDVWTPYNMNFSDIDILSAEVGKFDFVLADLGVSSMQIDDPSRGFTYRENGPLDLRMNPNAGVPAYQRLVEISKKEFTDMLNAYADEPYAEIISEQVISFIHKGGIINTTKDLYNQIQLALSDIKMNKYEKRRLIIKTAARVFQALRIDVNNEFYSLSSFMEKLPNVLNPGGRAAILTFHSGEDRIVKKYFKIFYQEEKYFKISRKVIRPSSKEYFFNNRAHSAKLRWAIKL